MNNAEHEEGGSEGKNITIISSSDLPPEIRPKSYSFVGSKGGILKRNITKHAEYSEITKINSFEKISSLTNLDSNSKARSFLRDFRKLFMKNKTSTDANTATTITATSTKSQGSMNMQDEVEDLNYSITQLRKKSRSWSHYDAQKIFRKYRKSDGSKPASKRIYSPIRALRNNRNITFMNQVVTENVERGSAVCEKV